MNESADPQAPSAASDRLRITIVAGPFYPTPPAPTGAVQRRWTQQAEEYARLGHDVTVVSRAYPGLPKNEVRDGVTHIRRTNLTQSKRIYFGLAKDFYFSVRAMLLCPSADICVTNAFWLPLLLTLFKKRAGKVVVNVARFPKGQFKLYKRVARISAVSTAIGDAVREQCPPVAHLIGVVLNPANIEIFTPPARERGRGETRTIAYTGRIHPEKGLHHLINAFRVLHGEFPDLRLRLIGQQRIDQGGGGEPFLKALRALGEGLPMEFVEPIFDSHKLAAALQDADYYCYPSMAFFGEACPVAPLEAMATGLPPVVSDLPQFLDYVRDGENGFIFEREAEDAHLLLAGCLRRLIEDPALAARMGLAARAQAELQSNANIAQAYLKDWRSLLDGTGGSTHGG